MGPGHHGVPFSPGLNARVHRSITDRVWDLITRSACTSDARADQEGLFPPDHTKGYWVPGPCTPTTTRPSAEWVPDVAVPDLSLCASPMLGDQL